MFNIRPIQRHLHLHFQQSILPRTRSSLLRRRPNTTSSAPPPSIVDFPPATKSIPITLWIVGGFALTSSVSGAYEQFSWDPKESVRSSSAGGTWGKRRQQDGLSELYTMLATSAAPFASWDPWGKIAGTRKIGQICAKGI